MPKKTRDTAIEKKKPRKNYKKNTSRARKEEVQETKDNKFSFDEEIVIGLRRIDDEPKVSENSKQSKRNSKNSKRKAVVRKSKKGKANQNNYGKNRNKENKNENYYDTNNIRSRKYENNYIGSNRISSKINHEGEKDTDDIIKSKNIENYENDYENNEHKKSNKKKRNKKPKKVLTKKQELSRKRRKLVFKILRWITLIAIIIAGIIYAMLSPIFNIKDIQVIGNSKVSSQTIISLSGLTIDQNIFKFWANDIEEAVKQNAYIDTVEVSRSFPDTVRINVTERQATYMLSFGNAYVYINNQGYILEITSEKGEFPLLIGYETPEEQIQAGNRLCSEDLEKLSDVLKIMEAASSGENTIKELITEINITDKSDYILRLEKEKKRVYLGDATNLSTKMLWLNALLGTEKDNEGNIYLNVNLNTERPYFREKV